MSDFRDALMIRDKFQESEKHYQSKKPKKDKDSSIWAKVSRAIRKNKLATVVAGIVICIIIVTIFTLW